MSDMQQILTAHSIAGMSAGTHIACRCNKTWVPIAEYVAHQADVLVAAGFGKLPEPPRYKCCACDYPDDEAEGKFWRCSICGCEDADNNATVTAQ